MSAFLFLNMKSIYLSTLLIDRLLQNHLLSVWWHVL